MGGNAVYFFGNMLLIGIHKREKCYNIHNFLYIDFLFQLPMFIVFNLMLFIKVALHVASLQDETKALRGKGLRN